MVNICSFLLSRMMNVNALTKFGTISAVNIEGVIATALGAAGRAQIGKNQSVRTEFLRQNKVAAFVITIALSGIGKNTVLLWTIAVLSSN